MTIDDYIQQLDLGEQKERIQALSLESAPFEIEADDYLRSVGIYKVYAEYILDKDRLVALKVRGGTSCLYKGQDMCWGVFIELCEEDEPLNVALVDMILQDRRMYLVTDIEHFKCNSKIKLGDTFSNSDKSRIVQNLRHFKNFKCMEFKWIVGLGHGKKMEVELYRDILLACKNIQAQDYIFHYNVYYLSYDEIVEVVKGLFKLLIDVYRETGIKFDVHFMRDRSDVDKVMEKVRGVNVALGSMINYQVLN